MKPKHVFALGVLLAGVAATSLTAAQRSGPSQPTEQRKLKERVDTLDSDIKALKEKADRAEMEKDYIERIQTEAKDYYNKAFLTQLAMVTIVGIIVGLVGKFGLDHIVQTKLIEASAILREEFTKKLDVKFARLEKSNTDKIDQVEQSLQKRIIASADDLELRSEYSFLFLQGMASTADGRHAAAITSFRDALDVYKRGKLRDLFDKDFAKPLLQNIFVSIRRKDPEHFQDNARKELTNKVYDRLEDELAALALRFEELASLVKETESAATESAPVTPPEKPKNPPAPPNKPTTE